MLCPGLKRQISQMERRGDRLAEGEAFRERRQGSHLPLCGLQPTALQVKWMETKARSPVTHSPTCVLDTNDGQARVMEGKVIWGWREERGELEVGVPL